MDTWTHLDHSMKIKRWTLSDASSSRATWKNLSASLSIKRTRLNDDDLQTNVESEPLIKDEETHPLVVPKFLYKLTCSSKEKLMLGVSRKLNYLDNLVLESLDFFLF